MVSLREGNDCFTRQFVGVCQLELHLFVTMFRLSITAISYEECICVLGL